MRDATRGAPVGCTRMWKGGERGWLDVQWPLLSLCCLLRRAYTRKQDASRIASVWRTSATPSRCTSLSLPLFLRRVRSPPGPAVLVAPLRAPLVAMLPPCARCVSACFCDASARARSGSYSASLPSSVSDPTPRNERRHTGKGTRPNAGSVRCRDAFPTTTRSPIALQHENNLLMNE